MSKISGIYKISSLIKPLRSYIGSAVDIDRRWGEHISLLRLNKHQNEKLQRHYNKYGKADFQFSILMYCDKDNLIPCEQFLIDAYNPFFNIQRIAGCPPSQKGRLRSDETKDKQRKLKLGKKLTPEHKESISNAMKTAMIGNKNGCGHKISPEHKIKLINSRIKI